MSAHSVMMQGRAFNEALMTSTCRIGTAEELSDPITNDVTTTITAMHYEGKCRVKFTSSAVSEGTAGAQQMAKQQAILSVPIVPNALDIRTDDLVIIDSNETDPSLVGQRFRIMGQHRQTFATAHRFPVEEVT